jgi:hypothetical protein
VCTEAVAGALGAPMLTVGHLARYIAPVAEFLETLELRGTTVDRGVDPRIVSADLTAEYGWFLLSRPRSRRFSFRIDVKDDLNSLADTVAAGDPGRRAVMKNTWDTGNEAELLRAFPEAVVVIVRRRLPAIEASMRCAFDRRRTEHDYTMALFGSSPLGPIWVWCLRMRVARRTTHTVALWLLRIRVLRLARRVRGLPADRTALLSYDEFRDDPSEASSWAAHLLDTRALARAFATNCTPFGDYDDAPGSLIARAIDRYWHRCWQATRARHARARSSSPSMSMSEAVADRNG